MLESMMQEMQQKLQKPCFRSKTNTWNIESKHTLQPQSIRLSMVIDLAIYTIILPKYVYHTYG